MLTDPVLALVGFLIFPAIAVLNVVYQRRLSPLATRAQQLRAEVSEIAHESFDGALVVKTLGREDAETARFRGQGRTSCATPTSRSAGCAACSTRCWRRCPRSACSPCCSSARSGWRPARSPPGELVQVAYLFTLLAFPIRALGWVLGELPRSVVGWDRVPARARRRRARWTYGTASADRHRPRPALEVARRSATATTGRRRAARRRPSTCAAGRTVALVGPDRLRQVHAGAAARPAGRPGGAARSCSTASTCASVERGGVSAVGGAGAAADVPVRRHRARQRHARPADVADEEVWAALRLAQADGFVSALPRASTPGSASAARPCPAASASGSRWPARSSARPRLLVLDDATSSVDPQVEAAHPGRACATRARRLDRGRGRLPHGHDRARRRGRLPRARPGRRPGHPRGAARPLPRATGDLVTAYEREEAERAARAGDDRIDGSASRRGVDARGRRRDDGLGAGHERRAGRPRSPRSGAACGCRRSSAAGSPGTLLLAVRRHRRPGRSCRSRCSRPSTTGLAGPAARPRLHPRRRARCARVAVVLTALSRRT